MLFQVTKQPFKTEFVLFKVVCLIFFVYLRACINFCVITAPDSEMD